MDNLISDEHAERILKALINDLRDRRGLKQEWNQIDDDIKDEIVREWTRIILETI